jgi:uncharacterized coiled-coil protein SlyX
MADSPKTLHSVINEMIERVNSNTQRLRALEQKADALDAKAAAAEEGASGQAEDIRRRLDALEKRVSDQEQAASGMQSTLGEVIGHLKKVALTSRVSELERMIEIYNPLKSSFVTKEEAEQLVRRLLNKE